MNWDTRCRDSPGAALRHYAVAQRGSPLTYGDALEGLASSAAFREHLSSVLRADPSAAYRWETPSVDCATLSRPFEFVLIDEPRLVVPADRETFSASFAGVPPAATVRAIPNLGRTAQLIVPRDVDPTANYAHLAAFLRSAPSAQVHAWWQCLAETARACLSAAPLWISTSGLGVAWLHGRIESTPKYYSFAPYRQPGVRAPSPSEA